MSMQGSEIFIIRGCPFSNDLISFCNQIGIEITAINLNSNFKDYWLRDYFIPTPLSTEAGVRIMSKTPGWSQQVKSLETERNKTPQELSFDNKRHLPKTLLCDASTLKYRKDLAQTMEHMNIKTSARPIEGGNIIETFSKEGKRYIFFSQDAFDIEREVVPKAKIPIKIKQREVYHPKDPRERYAKIHGVDKSQVIALENSSYHLDLSISDIGGGVILLNDLDEVRTNFPDQEKLFSTELLNKYRAIVDSNRETLEKLGFIVIASASTLYTNGVTAKDVWTGAGIKSSFANGFPVTGRGGDGKPHYVTIESDSPDHKEYFEKLIKSKMGDKSPEIHYCDINEDLKQAHPDTHGSAALYASYYRGAIRCQTAISVPRKLNEFSKYTRDNVDFTSPHTASRERNDETVSLVEYLDNEIYKKPNDINLDDFKLVLEETRPNEEDMKSLIISATGNGHTEIVKILLQYGAEAFTRNIINTKDENGDEDNNLIHIAITEGHTDIVKLLLENDADVNAKNNQGFTALDLASHIDDKILIHLLKEHEINLAYESFNTEERKFITEFCNYLTTAGNKNKKQKISHNPDHNPDPTATK